jgi:hypothetical protein
MQDRSSAAFPPSEGSLLASRSALIKALTSMMMFAAITANTVQKRMGSLINFPLLSCIFTQARYVRGMVNFELIPLVPLKTVGVTVKETPRLGFAKWHPCPTIP